MIKKTIFLFLIFSFIVFAQDSAWEKFNLAKSYEAAGNFEQAELLYKELYNSEPSNYQYSEALNSLYLKLKQYDKSIKFLETKLSINPEDILVKGQLGTTFHLMGNYEKAFSIWNDAVNKQTENANNYRIIINYVLDCRAFDEAIELLKKAKQKTDDPDSFSYELANIYSVTMKYSEATEEYCNILSKYPKQISLIKNRIRNWRSTDDKILGKSALIARKYFDKYNTPEFLDLESHLYILDENYEKAYKTQLEYDQTVNDGNLFFEFAQTCYAAGKLNVSAESYKYLLEKYPSARFAPAARIGYAKNLEAVADKEYLAEDINWKPVRKKINPDKPKYREVINAYKNIIGQKVNKNVESEANFRLGEIYSEKILELDSAIIFFGRNSSINSPDNFLTESKIKIAEINFKRDNPENGLLILNSILNFSGAESEKANYASYLIARQKFWQGNFKEASEILSRVTENVEKDISNDAIELMLVINLCRNDSLSLAKYAQADFLIFKEDFTNAGVLLNELSENKNLFILSNISKMRLAEILCAENNYITAIGSINDYLENQNNILFRDKMMFLLGNIYRYGVKNTQKALETFQKILEIFPNSLYLSKSRDSVNEINKIKE